jgi:hypothetical protein
MRTPRRHAARAHRLRRRLRVRAVRGAARIAGCGAALERRGGRLHCIALHCIALHCIALHGRTLQSAIASTFRSTTMPPNRLTCAAAVTAAESRNYSRP